jgi:phospholipid/cholesterol/gamma-HCH transport system permease protein
MTTAEATASSSAVATLAVTGDALQVVIGGSWALEQPQPRFAAVIEAAGAEIDRAGLRRMTFDTQQLEAWDSSLLIFLLPCQAYAEAHGLTRDRTGLPEQVSRLLALACAVPERRQSSAPPPLPFAARVGTATLRLRDALMSAIAFIGEVAVAASGLITRRVHMRWRDFWLVVQTNSSGALGIVTLIALLVGVIIAFLGVVVLQRFGAGYYVSYLVGFGMLREMGALMTGIIIAGRTGAAFAAELSSMKITEEIDAYTTLGISSVEHLVLPRMLGLFFMMPLLIIYADLVGIVGGMLVSATMLDLSVKQFMNGMLAAVTIGDALLGVAKGAVFGVIVGIAGCMKGLQAGSNASAVGRAATSAVVLGITFIIGANALIDWLAALLEV